MNEEIMNKMGELAVKFGQPVLDVTLFAVRVEVGQHLVTGIFCLAITVGSLWWVFKRMPRVWMFNRYGDLDNGIFLFIPITILLILVTIGGLKVLSVINWVGLFHPEVYLASKVLF